MEYSIDGVSGTGAKIQLDFFRPGGAKTGHLLPTGIAVDNVASVQASCIDAANPCTFVRFEDVGIDETILPNDFNKLSQRLRWPEEIREAGKIAMGMVKSKSEVPRTIPKIAIISPPCTHKSLSGSVEGSSIDLTVRFIGDTQPHRAIPLTGALCTAVAAKIKGSIVGQCLSSIVLSLIQTRLLSVIPAAASRSMPQWIRITKQNVRRPSGLHDEYLKVESSRNNGNIS